LATTASVDFVSWGLAWWTRFKLTLRFWFTFTDIFEAWALVVIFQVVSKSLLFNSSGADIASDWFFSWARNIIATVLASSVVATAVETVFITESHSGTVL
jgi:hypothetical protein